MRGPVAENESHRVDEINLFEKFQSIGVGDPRRRWLVDSGATCHFIAERWLSNCLTTRLFTVTKSAFLS